MKSKTTKKNDGFILTLSDSDEVSVDTSSDIESNETQTKKASWAMNKSFQFADHRKLTDIILEKSDGKTLTNQNDSVLDKIIRNQRSKSANVDELIQLKDSIREGNKKDDDLESMSGTSDNDSSISSLEEEDAQIFEKSQFAEVMKYKSNMTSKSSFSEMHISKSIVKFLTSLNITEPTPIQEKAIPVALLGRDIVGSAVTGSGKTAAYVIPILERLLHRPRKTAVIRVLILCPTRELAMQVHTFVCNITKNIDIQNSLCIGGLSLKSQESELRKNPDIVIATPGRFIDHIRNSKGVSIDNLEIMVIDEADRILETGFSSELNEIITICPKNRQTMLFSATMTDKLDELIRLSLKKPVRIIIDNEKLTTKNLTQQFIRIRPHKELMKPSLLALLCIKYYSSETMIFFKHKHMAHRMRIVFELLGLKANELHGNLTQEKRLAALENFRLKAVDYLMVTDLAARGLDIKGVQTVINYDVPSSYEIFLHRVGRTARAGQKGTAITFWCEKERGIAKEAMKRDISTVKRRTLIEDYDDLDRIHTNLVAISNEVEEVLKQEKVEDELLHAEMELKKGENIILHAEEIKSRPSRTWFTNKGSKRIKTNRSN